MKIKLLLPILFCAFAFSRVNAQSFFVKINGGYDWPGFFNTENILGPVVNPSAPTSDSLAPMANTNDTTKKYKPVHGSYGTGVNISLRLGYKVNRYLSFDLGITYLRSTDISCDQVELAAGPPIFSGASYYLNANISTHAYGLSIMPSVTVSGDRPGCKFYPYVRAGLTLPVAGGVVHDLNIQVDPKIAGLTSILGQLGVNNQIVLQTQSTVSIGINASAGVAYKPLYWMDVFAEINGQYLNVRAKSSKITEWNADGVSQLSNPAFTTYRTQINYVDELSPSSNNASYNANYSQNQPKQVIRAVAPFSNLGFNVGVTFYFGKKAGEKKKDNAANKST